MKDQSIESTEGVSLNNIFEVISIPIDFSIQTRNDRSGTNALVFRS